MIPKFSIQSVGALVLKDRSINGALHSVGRYRIGAATAISRQDFDDEKAAAACSKGRPSGVLNKIYNKVEIENLGGEWVSCSSGLNFTPHVITVAAGEDVTMKIISFSQQGVTHFGTPRKDIR
ncbi:hypothetical protein Sjap_024388 [Stephania japonica]|uniref:AT-hook motif nuclear-localized protein n=1 Tax=Stephania japonica TaxID=461633 RepID=A0AAP0EDA5_9MAGN